MAVMGDPLDFCRNRLPELFTRTFASLEQRAQAGDEALRQRIRSMSAQPVGTRLRFTGEGGGEVGLSSHGRALRVVSEVPAFGYALELPIAAAAYGVDRFDGGQLEAEGVGRALGLLATEHARELFEKNSYCLDLTITAVPVLGDVRARIGLGRTDLDGPSEFTLEIEYDELEDAREQGMRPHQLFMAGKLKMDGDVAKAMLLGMTLAQLEQSP